MERGGECAGRYFVNDPASDLDPIRDWFVSSVQKVSFLVASLLLPEERTEARVDEVKRVLQQLESQVGSLNAAPDTQARLRNGLGGALRALGEAAGLQEDAARERIQDAAKQLSSLLAVMDESKGRGSIPPI